MGIRWKPLNINALNMGVHGIGRAGGWARDELIMNEPVDVRVRDLKKSWLPKVSP